MRSFRVALFLVPKSILRGNLGITALTVGMLTIVAVNLLFVPGLIDGIINSSNTIMIQNYSSDLIVESQTKSRLIINPNEIRRNIENLKGVHSATVRNITTATIKYNNEIVSCSVVGIDPETEREVFQIHNYLVEGDYLDRRDKRYVLLGAQIAGMDNRNLELYSSSLKYVHAGDDVEIHFSNGVKRKYTVKGIFHTGFIQSDIQALITNSEFYDIEPAMKNKATSIRVKLETGASGDIIANQIINLNDDLKVKRWSELAGIIQSMTDSFRVINQILNLINILIAGITIFIVTYVDLINRRRQIGIQRAIGIKTHVIVLSYLLRALFYAIVGVIVGYLIYSYIIIPLELKKPFIFPFGPAYLSTSTVIVVRTILLVVIVAIIASVIPVFRLMRKSIIESIWG